LAGTTFQEDVACYLSALILAECHAEPPTNLAQGTILSAIAAETAQPIDDLLVETSDGGLLYVQAKTALSLSEDSDSEFAKVIDQFVRQRLVGARPIGGQLRPFDVVRDRFVLAVGHAAPTTVTVSLSNVMMKCRPITDESRLSVLPDSLNAKEQNALSITRKFIQRSWNGIRGAPPTPRDELSVLHLMHVLRLDLSPDGSELMRAKDILRRDILRETERVGDAWNALISICREFGPKRTGGSLAFLSAELERRNIPIRSAPSFKADIETLRKYSADRLGFLCRLSFLELQQQRIKITREVAEPLGEFASTDHTVLIGEPGAGKSGVIHHLAEGLLEANADVVLLAADMVNASSPEALARDLGLSKSRNLVDVLQNWSGEGTGYLLVDALDAARSGISLHVLCEMLRDVRERAPRWHIVASIREYDLRTSPSVQEVFAGRPHARFNDPRFSAVRHIQINRLSSAELSQVADDHPSISSALAASPELEKLVRNPFNLSLLCKLLDSRISNAELNAVQTQVGLLDLYWKRRIETPQSTGRLLVLGAAVDQMVATRKLHVARQSLANSVSANVASLDALQSDGIFVELPARPGAEALIGFAHNILFDYAVCRLWLKGLSDDVVGKLSEEANHELLLVIRPSIAMSFEELWFDNVLRTDFWERAAAFEKAPCMRLIGRIIAAGVAAQQYRQVSDVQPLIDSLRGKDATASPLCRFLVQAAITQYDSGPTQCQLIGVGAFDWMALASQLAEHLDQVAWEVRSLLWPLRKEGSTPTAQQAQSANKAATALLRFGLSNRHYHNVVRTAIEVAAVTISSDPDSTVGALNEVLRDENLKVGAHEWLHPLSERLDLIAEARPDFALRIVDVVFRQSGDRNEAVPMGGRILGMTMNKHDLVTMARYDVQEAYPRIWERDPVTASRICLIVMHATIEEERRHLSKPEFVYQIPFRGAQATLKSDASHIWNAGEHDRHDDWYKILSAFREGLKALGKRQSADGLLGQVLDVLRDEADLAIIWSTVLAAGAEEPDTLGKAVSELLACCDVLRHVDARKAAGDLLQTGFKYFSTEERSAIEAAIIRIPEPRAEDLEQHRNFERNRILGCIPADLLQSPMLKEIRAQLDAAGGPPPNDPDFLIDGDWEEVDNEGMLQRQGIDPKKPANVLILELSKAVKSIAAPKTAEKLSAKSAAEHLPLLSDAEAALSAARQSDADTQLVERLQDELIDACERLSAADGLRPDMAIAVFIRDALRRGASADRPEYRPEDDEQWDKDSAGWGSPTPRIDAAIGLMRLAGNPEMIDEEILEDITLLSNDPVPAVRYQVLANCARLYHTVPGLMWLLIERTCAAEPRTGILTHFCANVVLRLPRRDYERLEPLVRKLYRRCRRNETLRSVRRYCADFYLRAALGQSERRAVLYLKAFADKPLAFSLEASTVVHHFRDLIRHSMADVAEENKRVRRWALAFLTRVVKSVLECTSQLRDKHGNISFDQWPVEDVEDLRQLHQLAHSVATEVYFGSGAYDEKRGSGPASEEASPPSHTEKLELLVEGNELFDALCNIEFVESVYDVLQTLEFLIEGDYARIIFLIARIVRGAERDGIQYESMAADLVVRIVERYLSEYGNLFRENSDARTALLDILDVFVGAGWPGATRLTYRLGEVFR
jgi:hypothetical protein